MTIEVSQDQGQIEKLDIFHEILIFLESLQEASREFLGCTHCDSERPRQHRSDCGCALGARAGHGKTLTVSWKMACRNENSSPLKE